MSMTHAINFSQWKKAMIKVDILLWLPFSDLFVDSIIIAINNPCLPHGLYMKKFAIRPEFI